MYIIYKVLFVTNVSQYIDISKENLISTWRNWCGDCLGASSLLSGAEPNLESLTGYKAFKDRTGSQSRQTIRKGTIECDHLAQTKLMTVKIAQDQQGSGDYFRTAYA